MSKDFLKSKLFLFIGGIILTLLVFSWGREVYKKYQVDKEVRAMEEEIRSLQTSDQELKSLLDYFRTPEYKERQARQLLNLQKPGEFVVALPQIESESMDPAAESEPGNSASNFIKWWNYFFGENHE